jgi:hypothetical protein
LLIFVIAGTAQAIPLGSVAWMRGSSPRMTKEGKAIYRSLARRRDADKNAARAGHDNLSRSLE